MSSADQAPMDQCQARMTFKGDRRREIAARIMTLLTYKFTPMQSSFMFP